MAAADVNLLLARRCYNGLDLSEPEAIK